MNRSARRNRRSQPQIVADRKKVMDDIRTHPGTNIRQIVGRLGMHPKHVTHDLMTLRLEHKLIAKRDGYKAITYTAWDSSECRGLDAYLLRRLPRLPDAHITTRHTDKDTPVRSPEPPPRRAWGITSSMPMVMMEV